MSVALPERSWSPHKVLLVMPDLQIFIISPPDNLIMQRCRIHFSPLRAPVRDALFPDYFPALPAALYKPTRTPSIMLFSPFLLSPQSWKLESCSVPFCLALPHSYNNNRKGSMPENSLRRGSNPPSRLYPRAFQPPSTLIMLSFRATLRGLCEPSKEGRDLSWNLKFDPILFFRFSSFHFIFPS